MSRRKLEIENGFKRSDLSSFIKDSIEDLNFLQKAHERSAVPIRQTDTPHILRTKEWFMYELLERYAATRSDKPDGNFKMFLSCAQRYNDEIGEIEQIVRSIAENERVSVEAGFASAGFTSLLADVRYKIQMADMMLCIMTPDYRGTQFQQTRSGLKIAAEKKKRRGRVPSPWLVSEVAMAVALAKPVTIIVHEDIQEQYWRRVVGSYRHEACSDSRPFDRCHEEMIRSSIGHLCAVVIRERKRRLTGVTEHEPIFDHQGPSVPGTIYGR